MPRLANCLRRSLAKTVPRNEALRRIRIQRRRVRLAGVIGGWFVDGSDISLIGDTCTLAILRDTLLLKVISEKCE